MTLADLAAQAQAYGDAQPGRSPRDYLTAPTNALMRRQLVKAIGHLAQALLADDGQALDADSGLPHLAHAAARLAMAAEIVTALQVDISGDGVLTCNNVDNCAV